MFCRQLAEIPKIELKFRKRLKKNSACGLLEKRPKDQ